MLMPNFFGCPIGNNRNSFWNWKCARNVTHICSPNVPPSRIVVRTLRVQKRHADVWRSKCHPKGRKHLYRVVLYTLEKRIVLHRRSYNSVSLGSSRSGDQAVAARERL